MRVAMLQSSLPPSSRAGGVGYQVHLLATELIRRGDDVTVFVADEPPKSLPYRCQSVPAGNSRTRRVFDVGWNFARLDLSRFDVVHAHGDDWLFGRRHRVRTFYGSALMEARTATSALRRASQVCYYVLEWVASLNPQSVAISERTRRYLPLIRTCIPCAFDPATVFPGGERSPGPSILFVAGTLAGRKRGALLLEAFADVRREIPEAQLTIVSRDHVSEPGVTCLKDVAAERLGELYRSHWLLCSTSSYEGFGVPYVEALASGLPVVTTSNAGAREVLHDGDLGVLCTPETLAQELIALIRDSRRRAAMSSTGVAAAQKYSIDLVAEEYRALYSRHLAAPGCLRYTTAGRRSAAVPSEPFAPEARESSQPSNSHGSGATA